MQITLTRTDARRYATMVTRADGVTLSVPGYGIMRPLPHDLAHIAVETGLGIETGFWGSVAAGAIFRGMAVVSGRQKPHAAERAKAIEKANADDLTETELLVGCFETIVEQALDRSAGKAEALLAQTQRGFHRPAKPVTPAAIAAVCLHWRALQSQWEALPVAAQLSIAWPEQTPRRRRA